MRKTNLTLPELMFVIGTRGALAAGVALLASNKISRSKRRTIGRTLAAIGAITTIPAAMAVFGRKNQAKPIED